MAELDLSKRGHQALMATGRVPEGAELLTVYQAPHHDFRDREDLTKQQVVAQLEGEGWQVIPLEGIAFDPETGEPIIRGTTYLGFRKP